MKRITAINKAIKSHFKKIERLHSARGEEFGSVFHHGKTCKVCKRAEDFNRLVRDPVEPLSFGIRDIPDHCFVCGRLADGKSGVCSLECWELKDELQKIMKGEKNETWFG